MEKALSFKLRAACNLQLIFNGAFEWRRTRMHCNSEPFKIRKVKKNQKYVFNIPFIDFFSNIIMDSFFL